LLLESKKFKQNVKLIEYILVDRDIESIIDKVGTYRILSSRDSFQNSKIRLVQIKLVQTESLLCNMNGRYKVVRQERS
jgi:hypothetical protein